MRNTFISSSSSSSSSIACNAMWLSMSRTWVSQQGRKQKGAVAGVVAWMMVSVVGAAKRSSSSDFWSSGWGGAVCGGSFRQTKTLKQTCDFQWDSGTAFRQAWGSESMGGLVAEAMKEEDKDDVSLFAVTQDAHGVARMYTLQLTLPKKKKKKKKKSSCASIQVLDVCFFADDLRIEQVRGITVTTVAEKSQLWLLYNETIVTASPGLLASRPVIRPIRRDCQVEEDEEGLEIPRKFRRLLPQQQQEEPRNEPFPGKGLNALSSTFSRTSFSSSIWSPAQQALQGDARAFSNQFHGRLARIVAWNTSDNNRTRQERRPVAEFVNVLEEPHAEWIDVAHFDPAAPWNTWSLEQVVDNKEEETLCLFEVSYWGAQNVQDQPVLVPQTFDPQRHAGRKRLLWEFSTAALSEPPGEVHRNVSSPHERRQDANRRSTPTGSTDFTATRNGTATPPPAPPPTAVDRMVEAMALLPSSLEGKRTHLLLVFRSSSSSGPLWTFVQLTASFSQASHWGFVLIQLILDDLQLHFPPGVPSVSHHRTALRKPAKRIRKKHLPQEQCNLVLAKSQSMTLYLGDCTAFSSTMGYGPCLALKDLLQQLMDWTTTCLC